MDTSVTPVSTEKYQRLASEYSKLRAQASVLKKAVLDEQAKSSALREQCRQSEAALRRSEQEVDSLGFRNKQLEHRVAALQDEIAVREGRDKGNEKKKLFGRNEPPPVIHSAGHNGDETVAQDALIFEELQKKIMENAQLTSLIDDKEHDLRLCTERISSLEQSIEKRATEYKDLEKRLRREIEVLQCKNSELETKLVEAASMFGSEDALSVSGSDNTTILHNTHLNHHSLNSASVTGTSMVHTSEERIAYLEKEVAHWRTQFEIVKLNETFTNNNKDNINKQNAIIGGEVLCSCSSTAAGLSVKDNSNENSSSHRNSDSIKDIPLQPTKEQIIYDKFSKKYEALLKAKCKAESRVVSFETEVAHLQICLESTTKILKSKEEQMQNINEALQLLEEDLATTRVNYEDQISVLTEQIVSLSEQLARCK